MELYAIIILSISTATFFAAAVFFYIKNAENRNMVGILKSQKLEAEAAQNLMRQTFENLSNKIFESAKNNISASNEAQLKLILNPLKSDIIKFERKIDELNVASAEKTKGLSTQIESLNTLNKQLASEAQNLANALKGSNKIAGSWGEMVLARLLEACGLREGEEFFTQASHASLEGQRQMPDVLIKLPENKNIIIDSKVSLLDYERYFSAASDAEKEIYKKSFLNSLKNHVNNLSAKKYEAIPNLTNPDFVIIFIPIESAFMLLSSADSSIFLDAFNKKVVLAAPSTMLALLKTIEAVWKIEKQNRNTQKIAELGTSLYDKLKIFTDRFLDIGKRIEGLNKEYGESLKTLSEGRGNLVSVAEKMRLHGVSVKSKIDEKLLNKQETDE